MPQIPRAMIYGANGYTGRLIARQAVLRGLRPVLAGRNHEAVADLATELDCPSVSFGLENPAQVASQLQGCTVVLNCAGPFSKTARLVMEACMSVGAHYLDITGEIDVILLAASWSDRGKQAGVALMPAVGFDVVPTDCLAALLADKLPSAKVLQLAFAALGGLSPGTAKTMVESLPSGGKVRIDGVIRSVPTAWKSMEIPFRHGKLWAMTIPWGDVASAYYSTGIPNIEVYSTAPRKQIAWVRRARFVLPIMAFRPFQSAAKWWIGKKVSGPSDQLRLSARSSLWGRASDDQGNSVSATLETSSGYHLTALTAVEALERALAGNVPTGYATPSQAFGKDFILSFPDTDIQWE